MSEIVSKRKFDNEEHEAYIREHGDISPDEDYEMDLKTSDRKKLWALSENKCALCKCKLVRKKDSNTNVGEECHISSEKPDWPSKDFSRYEPSLEDDKRNKSIENAILLCANCHKIIDNPENTKYTIEELHRIKEKHEAEIITESGTSKNINGGFFQDNSERRKELNGYIREHNQKLIESVFKDWYGERNTLVLNKQQQYANEHLRKGYHAIRKCFEEYEVLKSQLSKDEKRIKKHIKTKLNNGKNSYLKLEDVIDHLYFIQEINKNNKLVLIPDRWMKKICNLLDDFAVKGQVQDNHIIEHSNEIIKIILNDRFLTERFKKINPKEKLLSQKTIEFERCLEIISVGSKG